MGDMKIEVGGISVTVSNLDKVLYPATGTTKAQVLEYYTAVSGVLLKELARRPVTRVRWPHGVSDPSFFEKNLSANTPSWMESVQVGGVRYPLIDSLAGLIWTANTAALELHTPQWRVGLDGEMAPPDRLVIDLDPGAPAGLPQCCEVALVVRDLVEALGLSARPVASGSKGLHLYVDLPAPIDDPSGVVKQLADRVMAIRPDLVVTQMSKERRAGKVFFDWSQNNPAKTTITPWSLRGKERPTVAVPMSWAEIEEGSNDPLSIEQVQMTQAIERALARNKSELDL